jgi:hypothetical protein
MSNEVARYLLDSYTMVIDNTSGAYFEAVEAAQSVVLDSGVTLAEYLAMTDEERREAYAQEIGDRLEELIDGWTRPMVEGNDIGQLLLAQIYNTSDGWLKWSLGCHYMPEAIEAEEFLSNDDES